MTTSEATVSDSATATSVLPLKRFKFLAAKIESTPTGSQAGCETPQTQLNKFIIEMQEPRQHPDALHYWHEHRATYDRLADTALDLLAALASHAYIERVFSVCGLLTQGRRNRMTKSLEMRARLKLNAKVFT